MALIQCQECGNDVSTKAQRCPHCGAPQIQPKRKSGCAPIVALILGACVISGIFSAINEVRRFDPAPKELVDEDSPPRQAEPPPSMNDAPTSANETIPTVDGWYAKKTAELPTIKIAYDITLDRKMTDDELLAIARKLHSSAHERTFMCYRLKGQDGPCWATTHADPDIQVKILGAPTGQVWAESKIKGSARKGPWLDNALQRRIELVKTSKGWVLEAIYTDGSDGTSALRNKGNKFYLVDEPDIYYVIKGSTLEAWSNEEGAHKFATYYKAK